MSTPKALQLPSGVRRLTIETSRGKFAALEALPPSGVRERQPALLVPGYTGSKEDFLLILQALAAAGRQVVAIDMRGQFETPGADDAAAYQLGALAADVAMVANWLSEGHDSATGAAGADGGRGVHLLGHSLGGLVTREVLLAQAARISSLTLMSSGPGALSGPRAQVLQELLTELDPTGPDGLGLLPEGTAPQSADPRGTDPRGPDRLAAEVERIWRTRLQPEAVAGGVPAPIIDFLGTRLLSSSPTGLRAMAETLLTCPDRTAALSQLDAVPL
ncbi:MAG: alpha/beta fold hydrolase, partial [Streptosporangiaceae bacterium]